MKMTSDLFEVNEAWIVCRLDSLLFVNDDPVDIYVLLDAASQFAFGHIAYLGDGPNLQEFKALFKRAHKQSKKWPKKLLIPKEDPFEIMLKEIAAAHGIISEMVPLPYLDPILDPLRKSFDQFQSGRAPDLRKRNDPELESAKTLIPDSYDLCPCASGKKYKFCCKIIFREIVEAMCAVEDRDFDAAVKWLDQAKDKVGETAEVLCRYGVAHSLRSEKRYLEFLGRALEVNPNHPRTHYLLGLDHKLNGRLNLAATAYETAIAHYPVTDKFHLNETWNNLGGVYFDQGKFDLAKGAWEKALMYMPSDVMTKNNLREFIYDNPELSKDLRTPSPFVARYL